MSKWQGSHQSAGEEVEVNKNTLKRNFLRPIWVR